MARHFFPRPAGLYDPRNEQDACGIGFVADIEGRRTHTTLRQALGALENLSHRGAVSADGLSGDGTGITTQIPNRLFARILRERNVELRRPEDLAVGMLFLPPGDEERCRELVEQALTQSGLRSLAWRDVPVGIDSLGERARRSLPSFRQILIGRPHGLDDDGYERRLYLARRRIERRAVAAGITGLYIPSFSHRTLVYKGLMLANRLDRFFPDLADPDYRTAIALFHQRYSTNTFPAWPLAQPFRMLAHNGEINTLLGNLNWMRARERELRSSLWGDEIDDLLPVVQEGASDSAALDNVFELLAISGRDPLHAMLMLIPEAHEGRADIDPEVLGFHEYHACLLEPWDGPAAIVFTDGRYAAACLDRNGLRPQRYWVTSGGTVIVASEAGVVPQPTELIVQKGRLGPGQMLAVDTLEHRLLDDATIKGEAARRAPYREWVERHLVRAPRIAMSLTGSGAVAEEREASHLARDQRLFGYGKEDLETLLEPMLYEAKEPIGSMGDDTPLAALSHKPQLLYRYFKQRFAQVTNPPIDPLRERTAMSLVTATGPWGLLLDEREEFARLIEFRSPLLSSAELAWVERLGEEQSAFRCCRLSTRFAVADGPAGLQAAVEELCLQVERLVDSGYALVILSDRDCDERHAPIPMLLATAAVHHHLVRARRRMQVSLMCDTGEAREDHHVACLLGYGATLVHPWLAYRSVAAVAKADPRGQGITVEEALNRYRSALEKGLLKIMSKMGICPVASYQGAQIFDIVGLQRELVERYFVGNQHRLGGMGMPEIAHDVLAFHAEAFPEALANSEDGLPDRGEGLPDRGVYRFRKDGEYHALNPLVFKALHKAVRTRSQEAFQQYVELVEQRPPTAVRDLLEWQPAGAPLALDEVEPVESIARRFTTQAMSHGALSSEAHETLGVAMNRLGAKSNSGEGGEERTRFYRFEEDQPERGHGAWHPSAGDWANSAIKQVASGRFGVTPEYLVAARELEIKMAQGSKPGEGGQIPGHKVTVEIAGLRRAVPGTALISPPPHHDIYSIEDLAQLIYDLKRINGQAKVGVKLVSGIGVGTIAAGVAKGYADVIQISGHDGGTGASPLGSIKYAGLSWELGLAEAQQVLVMNDLRDRVLLRVDGGLKTGRDVVIAALLGAEEYGFGTTSLVALGCIMARQCHLDTCPVGIASQRIALREKFPGTPEHVISFLLYVAEQVRHILAQIGVRSLDDIVGRVDLLRARKVTLPRGGKLELEPLLHDPDPSRQRARRRRQERNDRPSEDALDQRVWNDCEDAVASGSALVRRYEITNRDRTIGARLSGHIARAYRDLGLPSGSLDLHFHGAAGQSFGAFCNRGMRLTLVGEAQDYVGKGMYGGEVVIRPPLGGPFSPHGSVILGNTVLYGATGGALYAAGRAGERLCVRNSGARAVVEGCGDHGCEYMTGGVVVVLGKTGRNFAAGMSGGLAYVLDLQDRFPQQINEEMITYGRLATDEDDDHRLLQALVARHRELTSSVRAAWVLEHWENLVRRFWVVVPKPPQERSDDGAATTSLRHTALDALAAERGDVVTV